MIGLLNRTEFGQSLAIQIRVIGALMRREMIVFYGRKGLGFLFIFVEPLVIMAVVMTLVSLRKHVNVNSVFPIYAFIFTGWGVLGLCRFVLRRVGTALIANSAFLYHRNIKPFDIMTSRVLILIFGVATSFWLLFALYMLFISKTPLYDIGYVVIAMALLYWYLFFLSIFTGVLGGYLPMGNKIAFVIGVSHGIGSGAFFMVDWLPKSVQDFVLLLPVVNVTEMIRYGFFGNLVVCHFDIFYVVKANLVIMFITMVVLRYFEKNYNFYDNFE